MPQGWPLGKRVPDKTRNKIANSQKGHFHARKKGWAPKGMSTHPLFNIYYRMVTKFLANSEDQNLAVCERWLERDGQGFINFLFDVGPRPEGTTFSRRDNTQPYEKDNCIWMTEMDRVYYASLKSEEVERVI